MELITLADLDRLVRDHISESLHVEFKESSALGKSSEQKHKLAKEVAAMATAEGGTLIYGIEEDERTHEAISIDNGSDPAEISKEWIERVIDGKVSPRIENVKIKAIELLAHGNRRSAYVIHVPASDRAPHMVDNRYYMRQNFQVVPMEDYQVRDVMARRRAPHLEILLGVSPYAREQISILEFGVWNVGLIPAENIYFQVEFPAILESGVNTSANREILPLVRKRYSDGAAEDRKCIMAYIHTEADILSGGYIAPRLPALIYPGLRFSFDPMRVGVTYEAPDTMIIAASLWARDMPVVSRELRISTLSEPRKIGVM